MEKLIVWVEIPTTDFDRAVNFYNKILNMELNVNDFGHEKMAHFPSGEGAIVFAEGYKPSDQGVLISLDTGNKLDDTLELIKQQGGSIHTPKTKIEAPEREYFAVFIDSEGNRIGLYGS